MNTKLTPDEDGGYRLNGTKYYSTGSLYADLIFVRLLSPNDTVATTLLPTKREGIDLVDDWDGFGQRLIGTGHEKNVPSNGKASFEGAVNPSALLFC